jgi:hypothetical protein
VRVHNISAGEGIDCQHKHSKFPRALCEKQQVNNSFEYIPIVKPTKRRGNDNGGENTFVRKITTTSLLSEQDPETENPTNKWQNKSQTP